MVPRYISPDDDAPHTNYKGKAVLITAAYMRKAYGIPERYTPFASDEVLEVDNVVRAPFSSITRNLLTYF